MSGGLPRYRTHTCGELRAQHTSTTARLSGWVHRKRDHGGLLFIDLRDNYGLTQCVLKGSSPHLRTAEGLRLESVVTVTGTVVARAPEAVNPKLPTGEIELAVEDLEPLSVAEPLPIQVSGDAEYPEETRLRHRFLDLEMSFVTQEDVFAAIEPVLHGVFEEFRPECAVTPPPFPRIPFDEAVLKYGSDKPDLRNPLSIRDVTAAFRDSGFAVFATAIAGGAVVRAVGAPQGVAQPRSFFDKLTQWARAEGAPGLGYVTLAEGGARGPIAKFLDAPHLGRLRAATEAIDGDVLFFVCEQRPVADRLAGKVRNKLGEELGLIEKHAFRFCWVTDFPMYELNEETGKIEFSHNPFSMPQGGLDALETKDRPPIKAYPSDIVCNGVELSSGLGTALGHRE